jgi:hypothetical protein
MSCEERLADLHSGAAKLPPDREEQLEAFARAYVAEHGTVRTRQMLRADDRAVLSRLLAGRPRARASRASRRFNCGTRRRATGRAGPDDPDLDPPPLGGLLVREGPA